jgi:predicted dehydrogenase
MSILSSFPNVRVVAVCEKKWLVLRLAKMILGNRVSLVDHVESLSTMDLDAVYVTTPVTSHYRIVHQVKRNNIARNIFVEKPLTASHADSEQLLRISNSRDLPEANAVGYQRRYSNTFEHARSLLTHHAVGHPCRFRGYMYSSDFLQPEPNAATVTESRGGLLRDLGAHIIDLALWYFGDLEVGHVVKQETSRGFEESICFEVRTRDSLEGILDVSWSKPGWRIPEAGLFIEGTNGTLLVNDDMVEIRSEAGKTQTWYRQELNDSVTLLLASPEYTREDQQFVRSVKIDEPLRSDFVSASRVDYLIDQVQELTSCS